MTITVNAADSSFLAKGCHQYSNQTDSLYHAHYHKFLQIKDQITMLQAQREIAMHQPINQGRPKDDLAFFAFDPLFFFWELYAVSVSELVFTTITGVASVSAVAFFMVPHWSAAIFVCGTIMMVYIMLLGTMHIAGLYINVVTYIVIVMAIGLLVDFLMHILLRYYETTGTTRNAKVKETLETMGASILLGGLTTWLGVIPLAFSTTAIFRMVFVSFLAMVSLGCGVGLVLLPVLLSIIGPVVSVQHMTSSQWGEEGEKQLKKSGSPETTTCSSPSFQCSDTSQELSSEITQESCQERNHDMEQGNNFVRRRADDIDQVMSYDANTCASPRGTTVYTIEIADSQDCPIGIECGRGLEI